MILCSYPYAQYLARKEAINAAIQRVLDSGWYILGKEVASFETEFARYCGAAHAIGVANGTEALALALMALGIGHGDEVITVSHTAVATVAAIEQAGAVPILVDVDPQRFTLDPAELASAMSPRVRAIIVVHIYGQPADMDAVANFARTRGLYLVEDCAQAHGARHRGRRVGTIGDVGCFSFFPTKNLGALGDGGAIITGSEPLAQRVRELREYGWQSTRVSVIPGINSRLDELQAAVLRAKLPYLDEDNRSRMRIAESYRAQLQNFDLMLPQTVEETDHVYHQFVICSDRRESLLAHLRACGVAAGVHYPQAVHQQPAYHRLPRRSLLQNTEQLIPRILSLPIYPELSESKVASIIAAVRSHAA